MSKSNQAGFDWRISPAPQVGWQQLQEAWRYQDLFWRLVRRELIKGFQQTILGPVWMLLQPLLTTLVYVIIFGQWARLSTPGIHPVVFYMSGAMLWGFFSDCFFGVAYTYVNSGHIFSKVYFPRLVVPASLVVAHLARLGIQLVLFVVLYLVFQPAYTFSWASLPALMASIALLALLGLGAGLWAASFMVKYRDLDNFIQFFVRLLMFASPVLYPASLVVGKFESLFWLNPIAVGLELFRKAFFGFSLLPFSYLLIALVSTLFICLSGIVVYERRQAKMIDVL